VGPNPTLQAVDDTVQKFQSSVRINVGPNPCDRGDLAPGGMGFQSSVRINVGPNRVDKEDGNARKQVSILRED